MAPGALPIEGVPFLPHGGVGPDLMSDKKKQKIRAYFRKNRVRRADRTNGHAVFIPRRALKPRKTPFSSSASVAKASLPASGRCSARPEGEEAGFGVLLDVDEATCQPGAVLAVHGLASTVESADGATYRAPRAGCSRR